MGNVGVHSGFHVTFAQALHDSAGALVPGVMGILFIIGGLIAWRLSKPSFRGMLGGTTTAVGLVMILLSLWVPWSVQGTGWSLENGVLSVKSGFGNVTWPIDGIEATYVTNDAAYRPVLRTGGYSGSQLHTGHFRLGNGDNVLMFEYGSHPVLLLKYVGPATQLGGAGQSGSAGQSGDAGQSGGAGPGNSTSQANHQPEVLLSSPNIDVLKSAIDDARSNRPFPPRTGPELGFSSGVSPVGPIAAIVVAIAGFAVQLAMRRRYSSRLPERMASHWNFQGDVDGWMSKRIVMWLGPVMAVVFGALSVVIALVPSSILLQVPFWLLQVLFIVIIRWMYRRNL